MISRIWFCTLLLSSSILTSCAASSPPAPQSTAASDPQPTTVTLTGAEGAAVHGYYVADGNRSEFAAALPITLQIHGITLIAYGKQSRADAVTAIVHEGNGSMVFHLRENDDEAAVLNLAGGLSGSYVPANSLTPPAKADPIVVNPYWADNTWVFDDAAKGLSREPFARGVPEMIDAIVKNIPDARSGFRLTASEHPFPGYTNKLTWLRADSGVNIYRLDGTSMEGWLCPALFRYFDHTPTSLYIKTEPLNRTSASK